MRHLKLFVLRLVQPHCSVVYYLTVFLMVTSVISAEKKATIKLQKDCVGLFENAGLGPLYVSSSNVIPNKLKLALSELGLLFGLGDLFCVFASVYTKRTVISITKNLTCTTELVM